MNKIISPPKNLDDIPYKICDAYIKSGIGISKSGRKQLISHWFEKWDDGEYMHFWSMPDNIEQILINSGENLKESLGYYCWVPAIRKILKNQVSEHLDKIIRKRLMFWLSPIMTFKELNSLFEEESPKTRARFLIALPKYFPRSKEEFQEMTDVFYETNSFYFKRKIMVLIGKHWNQFPQELVKMINAFHADVFRNTPGIYITDDTIYPDRDNRTIWYVIEPIIDADLLIKMIELKNFTLSVYAVEMYDQLKTRKDWSRLYDFFKKNIIILRKATISKPDETLLRIAWDTKPFNKREEVLETLMRSVGYKNFKSKDGRATGYEIDTAIMLLQEWYEQNSSIIKNFFIDRNIISATCHSTVMARFWDLNIPEIRENVSFSISYRIAEFDLDFDEDEDEYEYDFDEDEDEYEYIDVEYDEPKIDENEKLDAGKLLAEIVTVNPDLLFEQYDNCIFFVSGMKSILSYLPHTHAPVVFSSLMKIILKEKKYSIYKYDDKTHKMAIVDFLSNIPPALLGSGKWILSDNKKIHETGVFALLFSKHPEAKEILRKFISKKELSALDKGRMLDRLEELGELGEDVSDIDPGLNHSIIDWQNMVKKGRMKMIPRELKTDEIFNLLEPLGERLGRFFITTAAEAKEERVPRQVRQIAATMDENWILSFTQIIIDRWLELECLPKFSWALNFIVEYGDDSYVPVLKKLITNYFKRGKPKANIIIRALGRLGSPYALSILNEIEKTSKYSEALVLNASKSIELAGEKIGLSREEMAEEMVPDFGMSGQGLVLDLGPRKVIIKINSDLNLLVHHETGKTTKSFTKQKKDEDKTKYKEAKQKFNILKMNFKPVLKQQLKLMETSFSSGHYYEAERWKRIYQKHPLMSHFFHGVIWTRLTPEIEVIGSFRISEDLSLIDFNDDHVNIDETELIGFWHPAVANADEIAGWQKHFKDYQLSDVLNQLIKTVYSPNNE
jgi:hypothetical protein